MCVQFLFEQLMTFDGFYT